MKIYLYCILIQCLLFTSCKGQTEQLDCFNQSLQNDDVKPLFIQLRAGLNDTLQNWIYNLKYERVQSLSRVNWKIDESIFINPEKNQAILLILKQDTAKYRSEPVGDSLTEKKVLTSLDDIHLVFANKEEGIWHYYYQSMESLVVPRENNKEGLPIPSTFEALSLIGKKNILKYYFKKGTCQYNDDFFSAWDINMLKQKHEKIKGYY